MDKNDENYTEPCNCGTRACDGFKSWYVDPFMYEIRNETVMEFGCGQDYQDSAWEI